MSRSLKVRRELIDTVKLAVRRSGFLSQKALAEEIQIALSTLGNFLSGRPVDRAVFHEICAKLSLDVAEVAEPVSQDTAESDRLLPPEPVLDLNQTPCSQQDWGEAPDVSVFYDRTTELETLTRWIRGEPTGDEPSPCCRVMAILGMGGMGKTTLSVKLATEIQDEFDSVIWRSLRNAPPVLDLLTDWIQFLSNQQEINLTENIDTCILRLIHYLRQNRCLLILDNAESVLQEGDRSGQYLPGYEGYGQLLRSISDTAHQSCLLITSREKPAGFVQREGKTAPVRSLQLTGLSYAAAQEVVKLKGNLFGTEAEWQRLIQHYAGNPLALKIVATGIEDFLAGDIARFLEYSDRGTLVFNHIGNLLQRQFQRLSDLEVQVMYWLAINREPVTVAQLQADLGLATGLNDLLAALSSLQRRSLIESTASGATQQPRFTQQPVVMAFMTEQLLRQSYQALMQDSPDLKLLRRYALVKATAKDYIRDTQIRLILEPLITLAIEQIGAANLDYKLRQMLDTLRQHQPAARYAAGNIIHLLRQLNADLTGLDLSYLQIWQADLSGIALHQANLAHAQISKSVFSETFGSVLSVAFSPDGKWLAIGESNGNIQIWDIVNDRKLITLQQHTSWVWFVIFSPHPQNPDQQILISASDDRQIKLWDLHSGDCLQTLLRHERSVNALALSPTGRWLASSSLDATIYLWDLQQLDAPPQMLQGHSQRVWSVAFSPDGRTIASSSEDQTIKLWDTETGNCYQTVQADSQRVTTVSFNLDGTRLASGGYDQLIRIWAVESCEVAQSRSLTHLIQPCLQTFPGHRDTLTALHFSPDGQRLASSSYDRQAKLWDVATGQCLKTLQGHRSRLWTVRFHPSGNLLATGGDDHAVKLWDAATGQCLKTLQGYTNAVLSLAINSEGILASGHEDETIRLWHPRTGELLKTLRGHRNRIWSISFAPQAAEWLGLSTSADQLEILISGSADYTIRIWNGSGQCLKTLQGHHSWIWSAICSPCGRYVASTSYDRTIKIWDIHTGDCIKTLSGEKYDVSLSFSPDGQQLASSSIDGSIKLWDMQTYACLRLQGHTNSVWQVRFSPNGKQLASASYDQTIRLWDVASGVCLRTFTGHTAPALAVIFGSGDRLISTGFDQTLRVWDISSGECLRVMRGHTGHVSTLVLDSLNRVYSGSFDETIRLWDMNNGECLRVLRPLRPYEGMNIDGITGLTKAEQENLKRLGAIEASEVNGA